MKELINGLQILIKGNEREKLKFLFEVYDIDGEWLAVFGYGSIIWISIFIDLRLLDIEFM